MISLSRREILLGGLGAASAAALAGCGLTGTAGGGTSRTPAAMPSQTPLVASPGARTTDISLSPRQVSWDLGGVTAATWGYGDEPGTASIRCRAGDIVRARLSNGLPTSTSVHWHGVAVRNASDGVPGVTQPPIDPGSDFTYEFVAPDPGTYFFHPHSGIQLDRGLYGAFIVEGPAERGDYDDEWVIVVDDWTDGVGPSPDTILAGFQAQKGTVSTGMNHNMGGMSGMGNSPLGDAGDVAYPHYLVNGRVPAAPRVFTGKPGQRIRLRMINAGSDTIFKIALSGHELTVTHSDGFPVNSVKAKAVYLAMGERLDAVVTLGDGVFVLAAAPEGKTGTPARAIVRTGAGTVPDATLPVAELAAQALLATGLAPAESARLAARGVDQTIKLQLNGQMSPFAWGINGKKFGDDEPLRAATGQRVRMSMTNMTMMPHPMHIHGHTWALPGANGLRKDTVLVLPMQTVEADLQASNPGVWMLHCHNIYHAETGMMTTLRY